MPVRLEGGAYVTSLREGKASVQGSARLFDLVGRASGAKAISLRVLEFGGGLSPGLRNEASDEVLYAIEGAATVFIDGHWESVAPDTGIYLRPGATLTVQNPAAEPFTLVSSRCPDPDAAPAFVAACTSSQAPAVAPLPFVRLSDRVAETTGDRWYRVLVDDKVGSAQVTQFVGAIPPGRAPDHFHEYEEVLCILAGQGRMWAGASSTPIGPGSCIFLPRRQVHCVENTGDSELRLLGVFYPAGSPAVRYEPPETLRRSTA